MCLKRVREKDANLEEINPIMKLLSPNYVYSSFPVFDTGKLILDILKNV